MPTSRTSSAASGASSSRGASRASAAARTEVLAQLKDDHKRVKKAYREFQKLDASKEAEACAAIVSQVLDELTVHATLEEELLYPAARGVIGEEDLIDEAEVEHETVKALIEQLRAMGPEDEKYAARFTVLCEYVLHHVKEEEGEMFPQLERARLDWAALGARMTERREELMPSQTEGEADNEADADSAGEAAMPGARNGVGNGSSRANSMGASRRTTSARGG